MDLEQKDAYVAMVLMNVLNKTTDSIENDAIVKRAFIDKVTIEAINQKIENQMNAISVGIKNINPKFGEKSKDYETTKELISSTMANYKSVLVELGEFYDTKIEDLILQKAELEANLLGSIIRDEYLIRKESKKIKQKENDGLKAKIVNAFNSMTDKLTNKKKSGKEIDVSLISKTKDAVDVQKEISSQMSARLEKTLSEKEENQNNIMEFERKIKIINEEINRINEQKKATLWDAMEIGNKEINTTLKRPKMMTKIKRFFSSRFNTSKLIIKTIIEPLNFRIEEYRKNDMVNM